MIKALETRYAGRHFRSRLEARWAVFFDAIGIDWAYEPQGFDLGPAGWYLPDFLLNGHVYAEVKPFAYDGPHWDKAKALGAHHWTVGLGSDPAMLAYPLWTPDGPTELSIAASVGDDSHLFYACGCDAWTNWQVTDLYKGWNEKYDATRVAIVKALSERF